MSPFCVASSQPKFIPQYIALMERGGFDVVTGTRYVSGGGVHGWTLMRKLTSRVANYIAATLLNPGVSDLTGSFRVYKRDVLERLVREVQSRGYVFQARTYTTDTNGHTQRTNTTKKTREESRVAVTACDKPTGL